jgi:ectoine hydroxylase-related dioxygenase (phytanoyl-CoA dioxygenase family)
MLTNNQIQEFRTKGFLLGKKILTNEEVDELREELDRVIADKNDQSKQQPVRIVNLSGKQEALVWQIVNIWEASHAYHQLTKNQIIVEEVAQLMDAEELRVWHDQIQYKPSEVGGVNMWHQDSPYWPILTPKTTQMSAWVALDDANEENGCMSMVEGSHLWGNQIDFIHTFGSFENTPEKFGEHNIKISLCAVPKGYVHYHHALTWHGSHANSSTQKRRAIAVHYMTEETVYDETRDHVMKPFVENVAHNEKLEGKSFPLAWSK